MSLGGLTDWLNRSGDPVNKRSPEEVRRQLTQELKRASDEFSQLERAATAIVKEAPSGIPLPDGQVRIVQATQRLKLAFETYQKALKGYGEFLKQEIPPEDEG